MVAIKKIGHWIAFLIGGFAAINLSLTISFSLPWFIFNWLLKFSDFWFFMIGAIFVTIFNWLIFWGFKFFFDFINKQKPDYWISSIFITLVALRFFYNNITVISEVILQFKSILLDSKFIMFFLTMIPVYWKVLSFLLISQFTRQDSI